MRVLVSGASGFVGSAVLHRLLAEGLEPVAAVRRRPNATLGGVRYVESPDLLTESGWSDVIAEADAVIHAAARVHVMKDRSADPLTEFRRVNVEGTLRLAEAAASQGVERFVFVSSIKANGETTEPGHPFRFDHEPHPVDPYGISKLEAEEGLADLSRSTGMQVTVVRPPLVYGPGVKANFRTLMHLLNRQVPLPLGAVHARRSLVAVENLADLLVLCVRHPEAGGKGFLVSDGEDLSVADMLRRLSMALGRRPRLLPVPVRIIELAARAAGKPALVQRLLRPLEVDIEPTRRLLGWSPPSCVEEAFERTAHHFHDEHA